MILLVHRIKKKKRLSLIDEILQILTEEYTVWRLLKTPIGQVCQTCEATGKNGPAYKHDITYE